MTKDFDNGVLKASETKRLPEQSDPQQNYFKDSLTYFVESKGTQTFWASDNDEVKALLQKQHRVKEAEWDSDRCDAKDCTLNEINFVTCPPDHDYIKSNIKLEGVADRKPTFSTNLLNDESTNNKLKMCESNFHPNTDLKDDEMLSDKGNCSAPLHKLFDLSGKFSEDIKYKQASKIKLEDSLIKKMSDKEKYPDVDLDSLDVIHHVNEQSDQRSRELVNQSIHISVKKDPDLDGLEILPCSKEDVTKSNSKTKLQDSNSEWGRTTTTGCRSFESIEENAEENNHFVKTRDEEKRVNDQLNIVFTCEQRTDAAENDKMTNNKILKNKELEENTETFLVKENLEKFGSESTDMDVDIDEEELTIDKNYKIDLESDLEPGKSSVKNTEMLAMVDVKTNEDCWKEKNIESRGGNANSLLCKNINNGSDELKSTKKAESVLLEKYKTDVLNKQSFKHFELGKSKPGKLVKKFKEKKNLKELPKLKRKIIGKRRHLSSLKGKLCKLSPLKMHKLAFKVTPAPRRNHWQRTLEKHGMNRRKIKKKLCIKKLEETSVHPVNWVGADGEQCKGCGFTTTDNSFFAIHISVCKKFNEEGTKDNQLSKLSGSLSTVHRVQERQNSFSELSGQHLHDSCLAATSTLLAAESETPEGNELVPVIETVTSDTGSSGATGVLLQVQTGANTVPASSAEVLSVISPSELVTINSNPLEKNPPPLQLKPIFPKLTGYPDNDDSVTTTSVLATPIMSVPLLNISCQNEAAVNDEPFSLASQSKTNFQQPQQSISISAKSDVVDSETGKVVSNASGLENLNEELIDNHSKDSANAKDAFTVINDKFVCVGCKKMCKNKQYFQAHIWWHFHTQKKICPNCEEGEITLQTCPCVSDVMSRIISVYENSTGEKMLIETSDLEKTATIISKIKVEKNASETKAPTESSLISRDENHFSLTKTEDCLYATSVRKNNNNRGYNQENPNQASRRHSTDSGYANISTYSWKSTDMQSSSSLINLKTGAFYVCGVVSCTFSCMNLYQFRQHLDQLHMFDCNYPCFHCGNLNHSKEDLLRHMHNHTNARDFLLFRCSFPCCQFGTNLLQEFRDHNVILHTGEKWFMCFYCHEMFSALTELLAHLQVSLLKFIQCPHCSVKDRNRRAVLNHILEAHPGKPKQIVVTSQVVCKQKHHIQSLNALRLELNQNMSAPKDGCENQTDTGPHTVLPELKCSKSSCSDETLFKQHSTTCIIKEDEPVARVTDFGCKSEKVSPSYLCKWCSFTAEFKDGIQKHVSEQHPAKPELSETTQQGSDVQKEAAALYDDFVCDLCKFRTTNRLIFIKHHKEHWGVDLSMASQVGCFEAKKVTVSTESKAGHRKTKEQMKSTSKKLNNGMYKCSGCHFRSMSKWKSIRHVKICPHAKKRILEQNVIGESDVKRNLVKDSFSKQNMDMSDDYMIFMIKNIIWQPVTGVYECMICKYRVLGRVTMKEHIWKVHLHLKRKQCHYCPYTSWMNHAIQQHENFKHKMTVRDEEMQAMTIKHMRVEGGVSKCLLCGYTNHVAYKVKVHVWTKHMYLRAKNCSFCSYKTWLSYAMEIHRISQHVNSITETEPRNELSSNAAENFLRDSTSTNSPSDEEMILKADRITTKTISGYECSYCHYKCSRVMAIRIHIWKIHLNLQLKKCSYCSQKFWLTLKLQGHVATMHVDDSLISKTTDNQTWVAKRGEEDCKMIISKCNSVRKRSFSQSGLEPLFKFAKSDSAEIAKVLDFEQNQEPPLSSGICKQPSENPVKMQQKNKTLNVPRTTMEEELKLSEQLEGEAAESSETKKRERSAVHVFFSEDNRKLFTRNYNGQTQTDFYQCNRCSLSTEELQTICEHSQSHRPQCGYCLFQSHVRSQIVKHIRETHGGPIKIYTEPQLHQNPPRFVIPVERQQPEADKPYKKVSQKKNIFAKDSDSDWVLSDDEESSSSWCSVSSGKGEMEKVKKIKYCCFLCPFKTDNLERYSKHLAVHSAFPSGKWFNCKYCTYNTMNLYKYEKHTDIHSDDVPQQFYCGHCNYSSYNECFIQIHCRRVHPKQSVLVSRGVLDQGDAQINCQPVKFGVKVHIKDFLAMDCHEFDCLISSNGVTVIDLENIVLPEERYSSHHSIF